WFSMVTPSTRKNGPMPVVAVHAAMAAWMSVTTQLFWRMARLPNTALCIAGASVSDDGVHAVEGVERLVVEVPAPVPLHILVVVATGDLGGGAALPRHQFPGPDPAAGLVAVHCQGAKETRVVEEWVVGDLVEPEGDDGLATVDRLPPGQVPDGVL